uniref:Receptor expression-enhancing protein n=1 Tax=Romanomermis culicivorax TaxID=13658 RepID=A0A915HZK0_ROMCU
KTKHETVPKKITDILDIFHPSISGIVAIVALYMTFGYFAELVCNFVGFVYPAYMSIKAVESSQKLDDTQWLTYWIIFALFSVLEFAEETIVDYFPIYWLCKVIL